MQDFLIFFVKSLAFLQNSVTIVADGGDKVNINARRKQLNLTLKEIAEYVGVSEATVSRWESGNIANMRRDRISALAQ